jgi:hypothetical protein
VGPRAGLDDVEKKKFLTLPGLELRPSVNHPVASRYTDYAIPDPLDNKENRNISCPCLESNPDSSAIQPAAVPTDQSRLHSVSNVIVF